VRNGATVTLTQDAYPGHIFTGTIVRNANAIDQTTRTLNVEVDVDNPTGRLLPGAYIFVHLRSPGAFHSVTIPSNTLLFRAEGLRVGVVRNGRIQLVPITIGHDFGNAVEVSSGLNVKDAVVLDPSDSLANRSQVEVSK
jgi:multidrug efflux pump subunit AcrA (membrane-fusion protein)